MQLSSDRWLLPHAACVTALMLSVVGCNNSNAAAGVLFASIADKAKVTNYVLVTRMRPEVPEKYFKHARWAYGVCTAAAKGIKHEVIPFPVLPQDFVIELTTYASDGKRTMVRKISYNLDPRKMTPENGCELRLVQSWSTGLTSNGQMRSGDLDMDGQVHLDETEAPPEEPVRASLLASRTQPKRINGVPLKCTVEGDCIVDPTVTLIKEGFRPVLAAYRVDDVATHGTALIVEPVSLTVGKPIDPAIFAVEKGE
jgi:hypothetical protein